MGPPLLLLSLSGPFKIQNHPTSRPCKGSGVIKILNNAKCNILFFNNKIQTVHFIDSKMIFFLHFNISEIRMYPTTDSMSWFDWYSFNNFLPTVHKIMASLVNNI